MKTTPWQKGEGKWFRIVDDGNNNIVSEEVKFEELAAFEKEQHQNLRGVNGQERLNMLVAFKLKAGEQIKVEDVRAVKQDTELEHARKILGNVQRVCIQLEVMIDQYLNPEATEEQKEKERAIGQQAITKMVDEGGPTTTVEDGSQYGDQA